VKFDIDRLGCPIYRWDRVAEIRYKRRFDKDNFGAEGGQVPQRRRGAGLGKRYGYFYMMRGADLWIPG